MSIDIWQAPRPKQRSPRWHFRVSEGATTFDSTWIAIRFQSRDDAGWLAELVDGLIVRGLFAGCPGHVGQVGPVLKWEDLPRDDLAAHIDGLYCHAEHMFGPFAGGLWYCQVYRGATKYFHTAEVGVRPRSRKAAWWLCEVIVCAALAGVSQPMPHNQPLQRTGG